MKYNNETINRCVRVTVTCDICKMEYETRGLINLTSLKNIFKRDGWSFGKQIKCPNCSGKKEVQKNEKK